VFSAHGGFTSGASFVAGLAPAVWGGAAGVAVAAAIALAIPRALGRSSETIVQVALEEADGAEPADVVA
ncbi:MAG TPA: hypothetical protein VFB06_26590, partial [Streptosporangiaceae bacterium]|nr:hypothetical protein [Streptosporangiaceae bacterium]